MFGFLKNWMGGGNSRVANTSNRGVVKARYDNALTTDENSRNWFGVDYLSAKAANNFQTRRILRMRSRYEVANNPYLFGIVRSNADDLINVGPTLQIKTTDKKYNAEVEDAWREWCDEVNLVEKIRTAKIAKSVDGEGFLCLVTAESLENAVKLYPCDYEADQVTTPFVGANAPDFWMDGMTLDPVTGRPTHYHVLKQHPGDYYFQNMNPLDYTKVQARFMIHWFNKNRPGQVRGIPIFTSSLDMFSELRAYRKAVLNCAQQAAAFTAVIESDYQPVVDEDVEVVPFAKVPIDRGMMIQLANGQKMNAFDAKQPTTNYADFHEKCIGEAVRPLNYPLNLALGTSQKFNFSSAKLDHINYRNSLNVERADCNSVVLNRIFSAWHEEAVLVGRIRSYNGLHLPPKQWHWPGYASLDPVVDAQADHDRLAHGTDTYSAFWARAGYDWDDIKLIMSQERKEIESLGLSFGDPVKRSISIAETTTITEDEPANAA